MGLRIDAGVGFDEIGALGLTPDDPKIALLTADGLLAPDREHLRATRQGRLVLDSLTAALIV